MDRLTANRYISLQQKIASSGGGVPQEIIDEVEALDATVNGDETQDPPIVGLVDIVGDLESTVEDLDITVNGDSTTTPETPGLVDIVSDLNAQIGAVNYNSEVDVSAYTTSNPYTAVSDGYARVSGGAGGVGLVGANANKILLSVSSSSEVGSVFIKKGSRIYPYGLATGAVLMFESLN